MYVNLFTSIMGRIIDRSVISSHTLFAHMYVNAARNSSDMQISSLLCMVITVCSRLLTNIITLAYRSTNTLLSVFLTDLQTLDEIKVARCTDYVGTFIFMIGAPQNCNMVLNSKSKIRSIYIGE